MSILTLDQRNTLIQNAMRDPVFKRALLDDPHAATYQRLGMEIPPGQILHVVPSETQTIAIIIPPRPADWSVEAMRQHLGRHLPAMPEASRKVAEVQIELIAHAWHDETFKQQLLKDAKAVVAELLDVTLPKAFTMRCFADDETNQYLILPPALEEMKLTDEQLEQVAGGEAVSATMITVAGTVDLMGIMPSTTLW
jgi:hypothetical protein